MPYMLRNCIVCGARFVRMVSPYDAARNRCVCCSTVCAIAFRAAKRSLPLADRFWRHVVKRGDDDCWEWQGRRDRSRYGQISTGDGRHTGTHRVSWELTRGAPGELNVLHKCDNPPCVNPRHLFVGTHTDNMRDARDKGRLRNANSTKTHCKHGHEFTPENTRIEGGKRRCVICLRGWTQEGRARRRHANGGHQ